MELRKVELAFVLCYGMPIVPQIIIDFDTLSVLEKLIWNDYNNYFSGV